ncbi:MAG: hypothetical protein LAT55_06950 [Opitutales bacterium]|nr:hypothetical protein [Opitutales bacterium]
MQPLEKQLRSKLENTIKEARDIAEAGAVAALQQLGVGLKEADAHLSEAEKDLRRRLRAHGRQLGDARRPEGTQDVICLMEEVAYEHWHRMLFARFLAENDLLMFDEQIMEGETRRAGDMENAPSPHRPISPSSSPAPNFADAVAISLEEAAELAPEYECKNAWEFAAKLAARMLPQIFRPDSPSFELELPPEYQRKLENLLAGLAVEVFQASDALGWVYQFWQAKRKDEVNKSEVKIGARELPAVTQLFTEPYMVSFLLDNSLGAWWAARCDAGIASESGRAGDGVTGRIDAAKGIFSRAESEQKIRDACALPGMPLEYLRLVQVSDDTEDPASPRPLISQSPLPPISPSPNPPLSPSQKWTPAAGTFDGWPEKLAELKTLDPCCGSGHFLVAAFLMLVPMRMELEGLSAREAVDAVLRENLHGLEIDPRCVEIAAFALALTAWRFPDAGGYRPLPELQLACSGLSISVAKEEWKALPLEGKNLRLAMDWLYDTFSHAPVLGSLIDPSKSDAAKVVDWPVLQDALNHSLKEEQPETQRELGIVAQGLTKAAQLLSSKYHYVMTNVPYLARGKQSEVLRDFCERQYPAGKNDLATVFLDRCLQFCVAPSPHLPLSGSVSVVLPQNWLFLGSYKKFREKLLRNNTWNLIARLGPKGFETPMWDFNVQLITLSRGVLGGGEGVMGRKGEDLFSPALPLSQSPTHLLRGLDVSEPRTARAKAEQLLTTEIKSVSQAGQLENPDAMIILEEAANFSLSREYAQPFKGLGTGDDARFRYKFWEVNANSNSYIVYRSAPEKSIPWGAGHSDVLLWEDGLGALANSESAYLRNTDQWSKRGVLFGMMSHLPASIYHGSAWDTTSCALIPKNPDYLAPLWCFVESGIFQKELRIFNQKLSVEVNHFGQVPFDLEHWTKVAEEKYPNGLPKPYSDDPTQWIFHGHPVGSDDPLQVAVARLLGYQWPTFWEREKRRAGDGEQDDAGNGGRGDGETQRRGDTETRRAGEFELSDEAWEKVDLAAGLNHLADADGIVCIPPVRGEASAADRLLNLLERTYSQVSASPYPPLPPSPRHFPPGFSSCSATQNTAENPWKAGCGTASSSSTASASSTAHSSGTSGTACATASPPSSTTTNSTPRPWRPSSTPTWATGSPGSSRTSVTAWTVPRKNSPPPRPSSNALKPSARAKPPTTSSSAGSPSKSSPSAGIPTSTTACALTSAPS